ncbi:MoaD/ThiS family protein [Corynebacterium pseudotuberculosis]|uniref:MoaD/ThiS family protein n=1 Tax=Corynebacterium pseudotuberculosis 258 TaxID=1168865 RepID=A0AAU8S359_CORPS|nr:MoaD/ThiS family protein [Corynebacterium pseudotuberculosis]AFH90209.3 MoaD/ThiS family protein [Corynebacterium pseudotuberculosis 31]AJF93834.2 MoaD/ThiS family protein [Corynebacterium pseudotuberculosis 258]AMN70853.1 MoaD/ThiS family protein [Corynebacterium pseudotuberculosis]AMN72770.1 molybdopterin synthase sulfur carrier subunit [Corynebacterium pseudotuberculosis]AMN74830.1 MoaD/ThiS family protein [Corynebacterium pseudotuberculosis]
MDVHYFAAARAARGETLDHLDISEHPSVLTLGSLVQLLTRLYGANNAAGMSFAQVLDRSTFLVDGKAADANTLVVDAQRVDVLPPFAGG